MRPCWSVQSTTRRMTSSRLASKAAVFWMPLRSYFQGRADHCSGRIDDNHQHDAQDHGSGGGAADRRHAALTAHAAPAADDRDHGLEQHRLDEPDRPVVESDGAACSPQALTAPLHRLLSPDYCLFLTRGAFARPDDCCRENGLEASLANRAAVTVESNTCSLGGATVSIAA
jgi:hypothetical protein